MTRPEKSIGCFNTGLKRDQFLDMLDESIMYDEFGVAYKGVLYLGENDAFILSVFDIDGVMFLEIQFATQKMKNGKQPIPDHALSIIELKSKVRASLLNEKVHQQIWAIDHRIYKGIANNALLSNCLFHQN